MAPGERAARDDGRELPPQIRLLPPMTGISQVRDRVGRRDRDERGQPHEPRQRSLEVHLGRRAVARLRPRLVEQVRDAARDDHHHAHHEDPDEELHLDRRVADREEDERNQRHAGHAVGLEAVRARADRVARVVARAVRDDAGVPRVVFLDVEDDLHQVRADVGDLGEDAAGDPERRRAERLADGEADEAGPGVVARNEQQDAEHDQQLDADEQHADAHAGAERNRVDRERASLEPGERRARVGERVHADAEPGDAVAAGDADQAEEQDDGDLEWRKTVHEGAGHRVNVRGKPAEVDGADDADEDPQDQDELALRDQVGLAGLVNQLGDLAHRAVHGKIAQLHEDHHPERQTEHADPQACHEQRPAVDAR